MARKNRTITGLQGPRRPSAQPKHQDNVARLADALVTFDRDVRALPGIRAEERRQALLEQILESMDRVAYVSTISNRDISARRGDPEDPLFDPLKAAILAQRRDELEEAFWLVFLFVHFGKHRTGGWRYAREVYGALGSGHRWNWEGVSTDVRGFRRWLKRNQRRLERPGAGFGNHRKYESLDSDKGTGLTVDSYIHWVAPPRTHRELFAQACQEAGGDRRVAFHALYRSMDEVSRFGRTARFDYLTMIGKLELAAIEPGSTYMQGSTGPVSGARLLFGTRAASRVRSADLDAWLVEFGAYLQVGMQVVEDALCNWQKHPERFIPFRG